MPGVCDELGNLRSNDLAGTIFGWKGVASGPAGAVLAEVSVDGKSSAKPLRDVMFRRIPNMATQEGEAAFITKAKRKLPAAVSKKVGKGKFVYYPGMYGTGNCANGLMVGQKHTFEPDAVLEAFQKKLLLELLDNCRSWKAENLPEDVFTASYTQDDKFIVHFLNAVNSMPAVGKTIGFYLDDSAFPALKDFTFTVPFKVSKAYAVSPEFEGKKNLKVEAVKAGSKITVPAGTMKVYSMVYLEK